MTDSTPDEQEHSVQPVTIYAGFAGLTDAKARFGQWFETDCDNSDKTGIYIGFTWLADLKIRFGKWLEEPRQQR